MLRSRRTLRNSWLLYKTLSFVKRYQDSLILIGIYVIGAIWLLLNIVFNIDLTLCPTKLLFNLPCPGCGTTRAINLLLHGDYIGALIMNPNIIMVVAMMIVAPIIIALQLATHTDYISIINRKLNTPLFLYPFFLFELIIWIYNMYRPI